VWCPRNKYKANVLRYVSMEEYWFSKDQKEEYAEYFDEHGFCVIYGIIDSDTIESRISEIWEHPSLLGNEMIKRDDPSTWNSDCGWYTDDVGFLDMNGGYSETELEYYWKVRLNPDLVDVFKTIHMEDVLLTMDRVGIMRPTKGVSLNGRLVDKPEWRTIPSWLHLDSDPWERREKAKLQGLVTLTEQTETSGGFCCIPGFHKRTEEWARNHRKTRSGDIYYFDKSCEEQKMIKRLRAPAGSLIIWNGETPHCNYPNSGNTFRIVDYVSYERTTVQTLDLVKGLTKVGLDSALCGDDSYFPGMLSEEQKSLIDFHKYSGLISSDREINGYKLYKQGCALECEGDVTAAVELYRRAFKMCPLLEQI